MPRRRKRAEFPVDGGSDAWRHRNRREGAALSHRKGLAVMKRKHKSITPEMIRRYFGQNARITSFMGRYRVRTEDGGEVKISQSNINLLYGGSDVHRAVVLLGNEAWGDLTVNGGPAEFKLAMLAHGEAEGINTRIKPRGIFGSALVAAVIVVIGSNVMDPVLSGVLALIVWL